MNSSLVFGIVLLAVAYGQMTFSDGWEKRQLHTANLKKYRLPTTRTPPVEEPAMQMSVCNLEYTTELMELHNRIIELYQNFKECQKRQSNPFQLHPKF